MIKKKMRQIYLTTLFDFGYNVKTKLSNKYWNLWKYLTILKYLWNIKWINTFMIYQMIFNLI